MPFDSEIQAKSSVGAVDKSTHSKTSASEASTAGVSAEATKNSNLSQNPNQPSSNPKVPFPVHAFPKHPIVGLIAHPSTHRNHTFNYLLSISPLSPDAPTSHYFSQYFMPEDGDSIFHALQISRAEAVRLLMQHKNDVEIRGYVADEIEASLLQLPDSVMERLKETEVGRKLFEHHDAYLIEEQALRQEQNKQGQDNPLEKGENANTEKLIALEKRLEELKQLRREAAVSEEVFLFFVRFYVGGAGNPLRILMDTKKHSIIDALIKIKKWNLRIWKEAGVKPKDWPKRAIAEVSVSQLTMSEHEHEIEKPKIVEPKIEEPKMVKSKMEEPKAVEPKIEEPKKSEAEVSNPNLPAHPPLHPEAHFDSKFKTHLPSVGFWNIEEIIRESSSATSIGAKPKSPETLSKPMPSTTDSSNAHEAEFPEGRVNTQYLQVCHEFISKKDAPVVDLWLKDKQVNLLLEHSHRSYTPIPTLYPMMTAPFEPMKDEEKNFHTANRCKEMNYSDGNRLDDFAYARFSKANQMIEKLDDAFKQNPFDLYSEVIGAILGKKYPRISGSSHPMPIIPSLKRFPKPKVILENPTSLALQGVLEQSFQRKTFKRGIKMLHDVFYKTIKQGLSSGRTFEEQLRIESLKFRGNPNAYIETLLARIEQEKQENQNREPVRSPVLKLSSRRRYVKVNEEIVEGLELMLEEDNAGDKHLLSHHIHLLKKAEDHTQDKVLPFPKGFHVILKPDASLQIVAFPSKSEIAFHLHTENLEFLNTQSFEGNVRIVANNVAMSGLWVNRGLLKIEANACRINGGVFAKRFLLELNAPLHVEPRERLGQLVAAISTPGNRKKTQFVNRGFLKVEEDFCGEMDVFDHDKGKMEIGEGAFRAKTFSNREGSIVSQKAFSMIAPEGCCNRSGRIASRDENVFIAALQGKIETCHGGAILAPNGWIALKAPKILTDESSLLQGVVSLTGERIRQETALVTMGAVHMQTLPQVVPTLNKESKLHKENTLKEPKVQSLDYARGMVANTCSLQMNNAALILHAPFIITQQFKSSTHQFHLKDALQANTADIKAKKIMTDNDVLTKSGATFTGDTMKHRKGVIFNQHGLVDFQVNNLSLQKPVFSEKLTTKPLAHFEYEAFTLNASDRAEIHLRNGMKLKKPIQMEGHLQFKVHQGANQVLANHTSIQAGSIKMLTPWIFPANYSYHNFGFLEGRKYYTQMSGKGTLATDNGAISANTHVIFHGENVNSSGRVQARTGGIHVQATKEAYVAANHNGATNFQMSGQVTTVTDKVQASHIQVAVGNSFTTTSSGSLQGGNVDVQSAHPQSLSTFHGGTTAGNLNISTAHTYLNGSTDVNNLQSSGHTLAIRNRTQATGDVKAEHEVLHVNGPVTAQNISLVGKQQMSITEPLTATKNVSLNTNQLSLTAPVQAGEDLSIEVHQVPFEPFQGQSGAKLSAGKTLKLSLPNMPKLPQHHQGSLHIEVKGQSDNFVSTHDVNIQGNFKLVAKHLDMQLKHVFRAAGDIDFDLRHLEMMHAALVAGGDTRLQCASLTSPEESPSAIISGGATTINTNRVQLAGTTLQSKTLNITATDSVELFYCDIEVDGDTIIVTPQLYRQDKPTPEEIAESIRKMEEALKQNQKKEKKKFIIKSVVGLAIGAGLAAFFGPQMLAFVKGLGLTTATGAASTTAKVLAAIGTGSIFGGTHAAITGQKLSRGVIEGAFFAGFGQYLEGAKFIQGITNATIRAATIGAATGAANTAVHGGPVVRNIVVGGVSGALAEKLLPAESANDIKLQAEPALQAFSLRNTVLTAGKSMARSGIIAVTALAANPKDVRKGNQLAANLVATTLGAAVQSASASVGDHFGQKAESKAKVDKPRVAKAKTQTSKTPGKKPGTAKPRAFDTTANGALEKKEIINPEVKKSLVREIKNLLPGNAEYADNSKLERIVDDQLKKYSKQELNEIGQELYKNNADFRRYAQNRVHQANNKPGYQNVVLPLAVPAYVLGAMALAWMGCASYQNSLGFGNRTIYKEPTYDDILKDNATVSPMPEQSNTLWMYKGKHNGTENKQNQERPNAPDPDKRYIPPPKDKTLEGFPEARKVKKKNPINNGGGLRERWELPDGTILEWDYQHGTVEKWNKNMTKHLGEFDHKTGQRINPGDPKKSIHKKFR